MMGKIRKDVLTICSFPLLVHSNISLSLSLAHTGTGHRFHGYSLIYLSPYFPFFQKQSWRHASCIPTSAYIFVHVIIFVSAHVHPALANNGAPTSPSLIPCDQQYHNCNHFEWLAAKSCFLHKNSPSSSTSMRDGKRSEYSGSKSKQSASTSSNPIF